jgi:hypothetical protein
VCYIYTHIQMTAQIKYSIELKSYSQPQYNSIGKNVIEYYINNPIKTNKYQYGGGILGVEKYLDSYISEQNIRDYEKQLNHLHYNTKYQMNNIRPFNTFVSQILLHIFPHLNTNQDGGDINAISKGNALLVHH